MVQRAAHVEPVVVVGFVVRQKVERLANLLFGEREDRLDTVEAVHLFVAHDTAERRRQLLPTAFFADDGEVFEDFLRVDVRQRRKVARVDAERFVE